jgi:hypothetical protein
MDTVLKLVDPGEKLVDPWERHEGLVFKREDNGGEA